MYAIRKKKGKGKLNWIIGRENGFNVQLKLSGDYLMKKSLLHSKLSIMVISQLVSE